MARAPTFEDYLGRVRPIAAGMARGAQRPHPFLGQEDLLQEALVAAWEVWQRYRARRPFDDLVSIGVRVMERSMINQRRRLVGGDEDRTTVVSLDQPIGSADGGAPRVLADVLGQEDEHVIDDLMAQFLVHEIEATLTHPLDRRIFHELLEPGARTLRALRRLWAAPDRRHRNWRAVQRQAVRELVGGPEPDTEPDTDWPPDPTWRWRQENISSRRYDAAWERVRDATHAVVRHGGRVCPKCFGTRQVRGGSCPTCAGESSGVDRFKGSTGPQPATPTGVAAKEAVMFGETKAGGVDQLLDQVGGAPAPSTPATGGGKNKGGAKTPKPAKVAKPAKTPKAPKPAKAKTAKTGKAKSGRKAGTGAGKSGTKPAATGSSNGKVLAVGTHVKYLGGSRVGDWLAKGAVGKVSRHYKNKSGGIAYGCRFAGRSTILRTGYIEVTAAPPEKPKAAKAKSAKATKATKAKAPKAKKAK